MAVPVLTAVTGAVWEAELVAELDRSDHGLSVVRRCVDLAELLAAAAAGTARAALLSAELRRLDRDAVTRLTAARVAVVGLVNPGDDAAERRLRQLGVRLVLPADAGATAIATAVLQAVAEVGTGGAGRYLSDPRSAVPDLGALTDALPGPPGTGRVVAVWGPTGAPGRTTIAVGLADEIARLDVPALLIDADVYGGVVAQALGLLDESPGVAAACRLAGNGQLDVAALDRLAVGVGARLRALTGIARADRWPELPGDSIEVLLDVARELVPITVVDCGFCIEADEEIAYDTMAPRRNGATLVVLMNADVVLCIGGADPVALQRLVRALAQLRETLPDVTPQLIINRLRKGVIPGDAHAEIGGALRRYADIDVAAFLPADAVAADAAVRAGKTLAEVAPASALRAALIALARSVAGVSDRHGRRRRRSA